LSAEIKDNPSYRYRYMMWERTASVMGLWFTKSPLERTTILETIGYPTHVAGTRDAVGVVRDWMG